LGNRQANLPDGSEFFSFRADRRYVVSPGSIHPNGNTYKVVRDVEPVPIPDWLCDWVDKNSRASITPKEAVEVSEDFDFQDFLDHYEIETYPTKDFWHITKVCPVSARRHQQSIATGFFFDGSSLGWHCFAQGCPGSSMSIGQLIRFLNESHEPYAGPIWDPRDDGLDDFAEDVDDDLDPKLSAGMEAEGEPPKDPKPEITPPIMVKPNPNTNVDGMNWDALLEGLAPPEMLPVPMSVETVAAPMVGLDFDARSLYGKLGQIAEKLAGNGIPLGYAFPAVLAVASALNDVEDIDHHVRSNIYVALLGDVGQGKSAAVRAATETIFLPEDVLDIVVPSSDRGLANQCGDQGARKLLVQDEYRATLQKCSYQGSSLPQLFNTLWNFDKAGAADKKGIEACFVRLSVLGNLTCKDSSEFAKLFGSSSVSGMVDRHLFGFHDKPFKYRPHRIPTEIIQAGAVRIPNWVWEKKDEWLGDIRQRNRLSEHMLRVALIQSCCNGDKEITKGSLEAAMRFGEWQERLREIFRPGLAENNDAVCFEAVAKALREVYDRQMSTKKPPPHANLFTDDKDEQCKLLHFTNIMLHKSYYHRFSAPLLNRVKKAMIEEKLINEVKEEETEDDASSTGRAQTKGKKNPFVRLLKDMSVR
jgi:hypothetical protein